MSPLAEAAGGNAHPTPRNALPCKVPAIRLGVDDYQGAGDGQNAGRGDVNARGGGQIEFARTRDTDAAWVDRHNVAADDESHQADRERRLQ